MHPYVVEEFTVGGGRASCAATSRTSRGPCSPWSTCPRSSRARSSRATRGRPRACAASSSTSSSATSTCRATPAVDATVGLERAERALPADLLRVRRRLGRPAGRGPPGVRAGEQRPDQGPRARAAHELPRAVDALPRLRPAPAQRPLPLLPRPGRARVAGSARATSARWTACSTPTPSCCAPSPSGSPSGSPRPPTTPTSSTARRSAPRPSTRRAACCRLARSPTSASTARARATSRCCCACAPTRCPRCATTRDLMLDELMKVIPSFLRRVEVAERGGAWTDYLARTRSATRDLVRSTWRDAEDAEPGRVGAPGRLRPRGRASRVRGHRLRARRWRDAEVARRVRALNELERAHLIKTYVGARLNRRHRPGRAFERTSTASSS